MTDISAAAMSKATAEGLRSAPGAKCPYVGKPGLAQAWRAGYQRMLAAAVDKASART